MISLKVKTNLNDLSFKRSLKKIRKIEPKNFKKVYWQNIKKIKADEILTENFLNKLMKNFLVTTPIKESYNVLKMYFYSCVLLKHRKT